MDQHGSVRYLVSDYVIKSLGNIFLQSYLWLATCVIPASRRRRHSQSAAAVCLEIEISFRYPICSVPFVPFALSHSHSPDVKCDQVALTRRSSSASQSHSSIGSQRNHKNKVLLANETFSILIFISWQDLILPASEMAQISWLILPQTVQGWAKEMALSWEKVSARLQPATAGHARLMLSKTVPFSTQACKANSCVQRKLAHKRDGFISENYR